MLSGCVLAPGLRSDRTLGSWFSWAQPEQAPAPSVAVELIEVTPDFVAAITKDSVAVDLPADWINSKSAEYTIGPRDVLSIGLWGRPELNVSMPGLAITEAVGVIVDDQGYLYYPYAGRFKVAGLTVPQLRDTLILRLGEYFKDPQISLRVADFRSRRIYVDGEVRQPGLLPIRDVPMTLAEALNKTGGFSPTGDQTRISVLRAGKRQQFNLPVMLLNGISPDQIHLLADDVVRVPSLEETKISVLGEVNRPLTMPLRNGRLSLGDALGEALGISAITGNPRQIYVVRSPDPRRALVYHLDVRTVSALVLANAFPLQPKDVVYVDAPGIVRFNRVLSLILPSAQSARTALELTDYYQSR
ncbi:MAG: polysaccharide biosynthesis/export family protein [Pseudomonadota bacterium]